jgi:hypothetical protein
VSEQTTNGFHSSLYAGGGLVDVRLEEAGARTIGDSLFLGIAEVQEALLVGTGASMFGDLVYSQALKGPNPTLDPQLQVYDSVQVLLDSAISHMSRTGPTNIGPGASDIVYGGDPTLWTHLAHTLKARFYMHTAEVRADAYSKVLAEVPLGLQPGEDYAAQFSGAALEQNFYYAFNVIAGRTGYLIPNTGFISLLESSNDPRRAAYFNASGSQLSAARLAPDAPQVFVSYRENTLLWAEAAARLGNTGVALAKLNEYRADVGLPAVNLSGTGVGGALLRDILTQEYINYFQQGVEAWNLYKRTCSPNLVPNAAAATTVIPARFFYDAGERQTNTNIPQPGQGINGARNADDPPNAVSDATGQACLGQR